MTLALVAFLAGAFSVLTPCILPVLPALLVVSDGQGRRRVAGVVTGVVVSFCVAILALTAIVDALGLPADVLRFVAAGLLLALALVLLVPALDERFQRAAQVVVRVAPGQHGGNGFWPGLAAGSTLGLVWAPCAGPILAGITSSIATEGIGRDAVVATIAYGLGMAIPLTAVAFGGRALATRLRRATANGRRVNVAMGVVLLATGLLFLTGFDTTLNRSIADHLPLTSTPIASIERRGFDSSDASRTVDSCADAEAIAADPQRVAADGYPETGQLCDLGPAPSLEDLGPWLNTPDGEPLTADDLRGKVVLVDFWTYSCINCIRTLPYVRGWHERYGDDGLVVVGVHTPEFAFEHDEGNVREALGDLHVDWPVALDDDYATWNRFSNRYWPAKYLIDRDGRLRYAHYGEGEYDRTEQLVRDLLDVDPQERHASSDGAITTIEAATPETYVGYERARGIQDAITPDEAASYAPPASLAPNEWAFGGRWKVEGERAIAAGDSSTLRIRYSARAAYLVMSPPEGERSATVQVLRDGRPERTVRVDSNRLYTLVEGHGFGTHRLELRVPEGVAAYAFTFG
jgi:cytochrome c biogenesis protein CcdA/thiol-disulfide isomerase/thioredoxin